MATKRNSSGDDSRPERHKQALVRALRKMERQFGSGAPPKPRAKKSLRKAVAELRVQPIQKTMKAVGELTVDMMGGERKDKECRAIAQMLGDRMGICQYPDDVLEAAEMLWNHWWGRNGLANRKRITVGTTPDLPPNVQAVPMGRSSRPGRPKKSRAPEKKHSAPSPNNRSRVAGTKPLTRTKVAEQVKPVTTPPPAPVPDETGDFWERSDIRRAAEAHERAIAPREKDDET